MEDCRELNRGGRLLITKCRRALLLSAALSCLLDAGCVYRRMIVRSDPPGAAVSIDGQQVGHTPCAVPFTYYGTRDLTLVKPGYETHHELVKIGTPWYQVFPLDFVSDNMLPFQVNDRHEISRQLRPQSVVSGEQLYDRAESLRSDAHFSK